MPRGRRRRAYRRPTNPAGRRGATKPLISIKNVDILWNHNQESNESDEFEATKYMVLRRGFHFDFIVEVSSLGDLATEKVTFELHRGGRARYTRGTLFQAICGSKSRRYYQWKMEVVSTSNDKVRYRVHVPPDAPVGSYKGYVRVPVGRGKPDSVWEMEKDIVLLFNPWCKEDDVYMADHKKRDEYVLNETGLIWAGTHLRTFTWPWNFAQFETVTLEAVLYLLDLWDLGSEARRSPVHVSRCLANMVNRNDNDGGILVGLWSSNNEDYADGTEPTAWSGSEAILQEYMDTKRPVKYAQCWVFGGTLTTTLRTIGIPARPITNFESAHDADYNRAIDYYFDKNGSFIDEKSGDSVWNYHVWVEGWMKRPDLDGNFGGWQALDATPQELSPHSRTMVVGPGSIQAIKDGVDIHYDNEFVISEVNADIKYHSEKSDGSFQVMSSDTRKVGKHISTKAVGRMSREDITDHYKYPEGSHAERAALGTSKEEEDRAVIFTAKLTGGGKLGEDLVFEVSLTAKSVITSSVKVIAVFEKVMYTGVVGKEIKRKTTSVTLSVGQTKKIHFTLHAQEYMDHLGDQPSIAATFLGYVINPEQSWIDKLPISLELPDLQINVDGKGKNVTLSSGRSVNVTVKLTNPLNTKLTQLKYLIEGTGLLAPLKIQASDVAVGGTSTAKFSIKPRPVSRHSERNNLTLIVTAESKELKGIMGTASITLA